MRLFRTLALGASMLVLLGACSTGGGSSKPAIKIGSDGFDEARVVAEVYAQVLEANGYTVDRAGIGLGTRDVTNAAIESGQIDLKPEYLGSGLAKLAPGTQTNDSDKNKELLQAQLANKGGGITVLGYTPGQDTNALVVRKETADEHSLTKWSDLTAGSPPLFLLPTGVVIDPNNPDELDGQGWKLKMSGGGTTAPGFACTPQHTPPNTNGGP